MIKINCFNDEEIKITLFNSMSKINLIKRELNDKKNIPFDMQVLFFKGEELKDDNKISNYIGEDSFNFNLELRIKLKFNVIISNKTINIETYFENCIDNIKNKIEKDEGIQQNKKILIFKGKEFKDNEKLNVEEIYDYYNKFGKLNIYCFFDNNERLLILQYRIPKNDDHDESIQLLGSRFFFLINITIKY